MRNYLLALGVFAAFTLVLAGSYKIFQTRSLHSLKEEAGAALKNGDYLASLRLLFVRTVGNDKARCGLLILRHLRLDQNAVGERLNLDVANLGCSGLFFHDKLVIRLNKLLELGSHLGGLNIHEIEAQGQLDSTCH